MTTDKSDLCGFRLACTSRSSRCTTQMHVESLTQGDITAISKRCNHQAFSTAEELILVGKIDIRDRDYASIHFFIEVGAGLFGPLKVVRRLNTLFHLVKMS